MRVTPGSIDVTTYFSLRLTATGVEATGLTITNFDLQYTRSGASPSTKVDATALAAANSAHGDNQAIEVDATDQPGLYRVDWPDAAFAAGVREVILTVKCATVFTEHLRVELETLQTGDSFARLGAPAGASVSADIAAIEAQTDDIGTAGAGLTNIPWNAAWDAEVQSEVADALGVYDPPTHTELTSEIDAVQADIAALNNLSAAQVNAEVDTAIADARLDELLAADSDIDGAAPPAVGSVFHELMTKTVGSFTYDQTTDSLEALRDNQQTAAAAALTAYDPPTHAELVSEINDVQADIATRASQASVDTLDNFVDTEIGAIITTLGTPAGASLAADIAAVEAQTDDIGTAGAGLTAIPWNAAWDAQVESEVADALAAYDPPTHAELVSEIDAVQSDIAALNDLSAVEVNAEVDTAIADARLDELLAADSDIDGAAPPTVGSVFHELLSKTTGSFTFDQATDSLEALRDNQQTAAAAALTAYDPPTHAELVSEINDVQTDIATRASQTSVNTIDDFLDTEISGILSTLGTPAGASLAADIAAIEAQTDDIGAAGAGLTAVPWNPAWDAEVQSEVQDAIEANHLDHLLAVTYDPASKPGAADALLNELVESDGGVARYTANALEQAPTGGTAPTVGEIADAVWDEALAGHLDAGSTGEALNAAGAAGDPWVTTLPGAYGAGSAGFILGTNLDAAVSSRASQTSVNTIDDLLDTEIAALQADIDDIQARLPAALVGGRMSSDAVAISGSTAAADAVEANIGDLDAAVSSRSSHSAADVWAVGTRTLTAFGFSVTLSAASVQAIWDALTTALTTAGSIGKLLVDNINATISSRLASAGYTAPDNTSVATILTRTDVATSTRSSQASVDTVDDLLDTEVAAIKAKTDLIPASPAAVGDAMTLTSGERGAIADAVLDEAITEPASVFTWAGATLRNIVGWLGALGSNRIDQTSALQTLRNRADSATIATADTTDDGVTSSREGFT